MYPLQQIVSCGRRLLVLYPKKAKESWLARNPVSHTEQPINLMTIGTLPFDESVEPTTLIPQNGQPSQNSLIEEKAKFPLKPDTWPTETLVSPTIDPSVLDFYGNSEPSWNLTTNVNQENLLHTGNDKIQHLETGDIYLWLSALDKNLSQETEDTNGQALDQQEES